MKTGTNNERRILEAAVAEFLDKGYHNAKMTAIAEKAGVTHAMLHYYFRTKENMFNVVFRKIVGMSQLFAPGYSPGATLEEMIRSIMESQFDLLRDNPKLVNFIYNETVSNQVSKDVFMKYVIPQVRKIYLDLDRLLQRGIANGTVRPVTAFDLLINMTSLNVITFKVSSVVGDSSVARDYADVVEKLAARKENNTRFILDAILI